MDRLIGARQVGEALLRDASFAKFQNGLASEVYRTLRQGFALGEGEVELVRRITNAVDNASYGQVRVFGKMLHGSASLVDFNFRGETSRKELGDIALVSVVSAGREVILSRLVLVQNKLGEGKSWGIDEKQLFLLANFPTLSGHSGVLAGKKDVCFRDRSGCLGGYGLLYPPSEMYFASAKLLRSRSFGKKSINVKDLQRSSNLQECHLDAQLFRALLPCWHVADELLLLAFSNGRGLTVPHDPAGFFGNVPFCPDILSLVRAWTQVSMGEFTRVLRPLDADLDSLLQGMLIAAGMRDFLDLEGEELDSGHAVLVAHMNIGAET